MWCRLDQPPMKTRQKAEKSKRTSERCTVQELTPWCWQRRKGCWLERSNSWMGQAEQSAQHVCSLGKRTQVNFSFSFRSRWHRSARKAVDQLWYLLCFLVNLHVHSHWLWCAQDSRSTEVFLAEDCAWLCASHGSPFQTLPFAGGSLGLCNLCVPLGG